MFCFLNAGLEIFIGLQAKTIHGHNDIFMLIQMENIHERMNQPVRHEFFQRCLGQPLDVQGVPADKQRIGLHGFGRAVRIFTVEGLCLIYCTDSCMSSADRALVRNGKCPASGQILRDLRDDHVGLVDLQFVPDTKLQFFYDAHVVHAGAGNGSSFQLDRLEYSHRIQQPGAGRTPLHLQQMRHPLFVRPLECVGIPGIFRRSAETVSIGNIIIQGNKAVGGEFVFRHLCGKITHGVVQRVCCYVSPLHGSKALFLQPQELLFPGVFEIRFRDGPHQ